MNNLPNCRLDIIIFYQHDTYFIYDNSRVSMAFQHFYMSFIYCTKDTNVVCDILYWVILAKYMENQYITTWN